MRVVQASLLALAVVFFLEGNRGGEARAATGAAPDGVFGVVTLSGPVPKLAPRPVISDVAVCGKADRPSPALVLGKGKELGNVFAPAARDRASSASMRSSKG